MRMLMLDSPDVIRPRPYSKPPPAPKSNSTPEAPGPSSGHGAIMQRANKTAPAGTCRDIGRLAGQDGNCRIEFHVPAVIFIRTPPVLPVRDRALSTGPAKPRP